MCYLCFRSLCFLSSSSCSLFNSFERFLHSFSTTLIAYSSSILPIGSLLILSLVYCLRFLFITPPPCSLHRCLCKFFQPSLLILPLSFSSYFSSILLLVFCSFFHWFIVYGSFSLLHHRASLSLHCCRCYHRYPSSLSLPSP